MLCKWHSLPLTVAAVLSGIIAGVAAAPAPEITSPPFLRARAPEFTGVSLPPVSIPSISIPQVSGTKPTATKFSLSLNLPSPTCTQTIVPDKNGYVPPKTCNALYNFYPSFNAAVAMSIVFGILSFVHIVQAAMFRTGFCWVVIMGSLWEFIGYVSRSFGTKHQQNAGLATVSQIFILLAPLWVNAFAYMVLARMIYFFIPSKTLCGIKPSILAIIFVTLDFSSFVIQLVGGGMAGPGQTPEALMRGIHIYMGGIGLQEFFIVIFLGLAVTFHLEMLKIERTGVLSGTPKAKWRWMLYALYASLTFITVRIIYRLAEFSAGDSMDNPLPYHEVYAYVLDAVPIFFATVTWNISHPGRIFKGPDSVMPGGQIRGVCCFCCSGRNKKRKERQRKEEANRSQAESTHSEIYALRDNPGGRR